MARLQLGARRRAARLALAVLAHDQPASGVAEAAELDELVVDLLALVAGRHAGIERGAQRRVRLHKDFLGERRPPLALPYCFRPWSRRSGLGGSAIAASEFMAASQGLSFTSSRSALAAGPKRSSGTRYLTDLPNLRHIGAFGSRRPVRRSRLRALARPCSLNWNSCAY